ncbi:BMP family ABC transporter substrate-binding protein [Virgisporangium aliadipatigenens]|uniref:BMP family ABC transporter substrate-binding protein n=1 Tax=Virgisporangium aliadipatigenens TaxID=741659 RepID=A0A8J3YWV5_9ACTN|nr:BMP family ABC transporter substrate-binding protein [Virgisporangium aliadipatigenens]GIJ51143.1 BMP family ABC transporter substrate-binding protein [Virgisporangium aliadipatigenens]
MRQARGMQLLAVASAAVLLLGVSACGGGDDDSGTGDGKTKVKVGLAFDIGGRGDKSFNDAAAAGLDKAKQELDVEVKDLAANATESENDKYERLKLLCTSGYNPVIAVGFVYAGADPATGPVAKAAKECPDTKFAIIDSVVPGSNVASLVFAEEQGSFLVGAAAALKTTSGTVGFVGGCDTPLIKKFEAGFKAGAAAAKAGTKVLAQYISTPADKCSGFNDPAKGQTVAEGMYDQGADIVYQAAGGSGSGVFKAAKAKGKLAIGVDSDQYNTADAAVKDVIITSMLKRVDVAVYDFVKSVSNNTFAAGTLTFDLKKEGVGYSTSGGKVDDIKPKLDEYKQQIIDGKVTVPTAPTS